MNEIKSWLGMFLALLLLSGGCAVAEVKLDASSNGGQTELARGQNLVVTLDSNRTTGYGWAVDNVDAAVLRQVGDSVFQSPNSNPNVVGAGGNETFRFEAASAGTTTLKLAYRRSWETGVAPIKTFTVRVTVR